MTKEIEARMLDQAQQRMNLRVETIVQRLRSLADRVEAESKRADATRPDRLAATVQNEVIWGFANLGIDQLSEITSSLVDSLTMKGN